MPGGRIPPDNRPASAKGVGKKTKRHDLERRNVPFLHGSDLQQGDVQAMEQGQRVAPKQTQQPARAQPQSIPNQSQNSSSGAQIPDAIEFLAGKQGAEFNVPTGTEAPRNEAAMNWLPLVRKLATSPGGSGQLASAFINQARALQGGGTMARIVDLNAIDAGIEAMINELQ